MCLIMQMDEYKLCECGCGTEILKYDRYKRIRRFVYGHQTKGKRMTQSQKNKISKTKTGIKKSKEHKLKISKGMKMYWDIKKNMNLKPTEMV